MPTCPAPGCTAEFLTEDELRKHFLSEHPELGAPSAGLFRDMIRYNTKAQREQVASLLTRIVFGRNGADKEEVLRVFFWFQDRLR